MRVPADDFHSKREASKKRIPQYGSFLMSKTYKTSMLTHRLTVSAGALDVAKVWEPSSDGRVRRPTDSYFGRPNSSYSDHVFRPLTEDGALVNKQFN